MQVSRVSVGQIVGRVVGLWRYPVKSMARESLSKALVSWHGVSGDRRWAFIRKGVEQSGFPWLTLRERGDLNRYCPSIIDPDQPDKSPTVVRTPTGRILDVTNPMLAEELCPGARVIRQDRGVFDTFPLSLITTQTISQLEASVGTKLQVERFRPNILVEAAEQSLYPEDNWVGGVLAIGTVRIRIDKRDGRCAVITIDPQSSERNPEILRKVVRDRQGCLGVYGTTVQPGEIALGDPVMMA